MEIKPINSKYHYYLYTNWFVQIFSAEKGTREWELQHAEEGTPECEELKLLCSVLEQYEHSLVIEEPKPGKDAMIMPFGKYKGCQIEDVFTDVQHTRWCLKQGFVQRDYPELYSHLKALYDTIKEEVESTMYFYCLVLSNNAGIKVGKTKIFIPKRLYNFVCSTTNYTISFEKNPIEIKKSVVFKTNDLDIEKEIKNIFKSRRLHGHELLDVELKEIEIELRKRTKKNNTFFYYQKPLFDFIPYESLQALRKDFVIYLDRHVHFRDEYESHLWEKGLNGFYNPNFLGGNLN